ncbi:hypothetical protein ACI8AF_21335 [Blastococcus sp. SYSU D00669]
MMRTSKLVLAGAGIAAATAAGSAFTASNTVPASVAGYGQGTVTGATVTDIDYTPLSSDNSKLDVIVFTTSTNVTGRVATLTLKSGSTLVGSPHTCTLGTYTTDMTITCDVVGDPLFTAFDAVGLTVVDND